MSRAQGISRCSGAFVFLSLLLAACRTEPQPVTLPEPTGSLAVARMTLRLMDADRPEVMTDAADDRRELVVHLWYPTTVRDPAQPAPYVPDIEALGRTLGSARAGAFSLVRLHAQADVPPAAADPPRPLLLLSPGNDMLSAQYSALTEDLVSHGFVVAAVDHPYDASAVRLADGRVAPFLDSRWPRLPAPDPTGKPAADSPYALFYRARVQVRAADMRLVLDRLPALASEPREGRVLAGIDWQKVGVLGHSVGGVAVGETCQTDPRVKACLNLDGDSGNGPFYLRADGSGFVQPFMMFTKPFELSDQQLAQWGLTREEWLNGLRAQRNRFFGSIASGSYRVVLSGASHRSFSDDEYVVEALDGDDRTAHLRRMALVRLYSRAFFDKYLKAAPAPLLDGPVADPEIAVERWPGRESGGEAP